MHNFDLSGYIAKKIMKYLCIIVFCVIIGLYIVFMLGVSTGRLTSLDEQNKARIVELEKALKQYQEGKLK